MPWKETSTMKEREQFIKEAKIGLNSFSALCKKYNISRQTGYKWVNRERQLGAIGLKDLSRKPKRSPNQTPTLMEDEVLKVRQAHPIWGGRKIRHILLREGKDNVPAASTITSILKRNEKITPEESRKREAYIRFEYEAPNQMWQMDYKGYFPLMDGTKCHPLTIVDDYSRFLVGLRACPDEKALTTQEQLSLIFKQYGLPKKLLMDNGAPWGDDKDSPHTFLTAWFMALGIKVLHIGAYHPQTNGKNERFNRTLLDEVIAQKGFENLEDAQRHFDEWANIYNTYRPHEAIGMEVPASRYEPSKQRYPNKILPPDYGPVATVRKTDQAGSFMFDGFRLRLGKAFKKKTVELRPTTNEGEIEVYYYDNLIHRFDLRKKKC